MRIRCQHLHRIQARYRQATYYLVTRLVGPATLASQDRKRRRSPIAGQPLRQSRGSILSHWGISSHRRFETPAEEEGSPVRQDARLVANVLFRVDVWSLFVLIPKADLFQPQTVLLGGFSPHWSTEQLGALRHLMHNYLEFPGQNIHRKQGRAKISKTRPAGIISRPGRNSEIQKHVLASSPGHHDYTHPL